MTVWALLLLPLVAVGMAMALFLSLGNSDGAQAASPGTDLSINVTNVVPVPVPALVGCNTNNAPGTATCSIAAGSTFQVEAVLKTADTYASNDVSVVYNAPVAFIDKNGLNPFAEIIGADCGIQAENLANLSEKVEDLTPGFEPGDTGFGEYEASCIDSTPASPATGPDTNFRMNAICQSQGTGTIVLKLGGPLDSHITDPGTNVVNDKRGAGSTETLTIECTPPAGTVNVNVSETNVAGKKVSDSCVLVFALTDVGPLSDPQTVNVPVDIVSDNNAKATACDDLGPSPLPDVNQNGIADDGSFDLSDSDTDVGQLAIGISGAARLELGDEWHVLLIQTSPKHDIGAQTKEVCTLGSSPPPADPDSCQVDLVVDRTDGNATILFNDLVTGGPVLSQCVRVYDDPPTNLNLVSVWCDGGTVPPSQNGETKADGDGVKDGAIEGTLPLGVYSIDYDPVNQPSDRNVKDPVKVTCDLSGTSTATQTCTVKFNFNPTVPFNLKVPTIANLFLTSQAVKSGSGKLPPQTCEQGTDVARFDHVLSNKPTSPDPKDITPPIEIQQVGAFEMEVRFDNKLVCVNLVPGQYWVANGVNLPSGVATCFIDDKDDGIRPQNLARIGCLLKGKVGIVDPQTPILTCSGKDTVLASVHMACIEVRPQPELYTQIIADQDNGMDLMILNQDCNLADLQGHAIQKIGCDDSSLSIRWLEGDVNGDCRVDVLDQAILSARWGALSGSGLFNPRFDLQPSGFVANGIEGDGDIDIKDVQFVYGRHGSICENQNQEGFVGPAHPEQPPRNPNAPGG
jgi:hypothetical protein